ncbi:pyroglutamyl-peptidase I [Erysipelotrichaceae bacterium 51-3]
MKILITGFNPFGNESVNPAFEAVKLLPDTIKSAEIVKLEIPTEFKRAGKVLQEGIEANHPDVVICVGQAGGRSAITPEQVGINLMDGRIPDNAGYQPFDTPVREDGPTAYFTSLPVKAMVQSIRDAGIPAFVSYSAGTYVCNFLMYELLYQIEHFFPGIKGGFIHVPFMTEQAVNKANGTPSMDLKTISRGLEKAVEAVIEHDTDIELHTGDTH